MGRGPSDGEGSKQSSGWLHAFGHNEGVWLQTGHLFNISRGTTCFWTCYLHGEHSMRSKFKRKCRCVCSWRADFGTTHTKAACCVFNRPQGAPSTRALLWTSNPNTSCLSSVEMRHIIGSNPSTFPPKNPQTLGRYLKFPQLINQLTNRDIEAIGGTMQLWLAWVANCPCVLCYFFK